MTASALTRPGQRERLTVKVGELDWRLAGLIAAVACFGGLILYAIAPQIGSGPPKGSMEPWAAPQMIRFFLLFGLMMGLALIDLRVWYALAYPLYGVALLMLMAVMVVGVTRLGAKRWLGHGHFTIQPSEIMKIALVMALARFYHGSTAKQARWSVRLLIPAAMIAVPTLLVLKQPDLGTAILLAATGGVVMIMAGLDWRAIAAGGVGLCVAAPLFVMFAAHGYQKQRLLTFLNPAADPSGSGYHIMQSEIALGSGGFLGKGFLLGSQAQLNYLPEKQTDFIFASVAEEFGFVGCFALLVAYGLIVAMCLRIASLSYSHFGRLSAAGVTATFALYILINGAMVMGLAPVVGVPMPLLSYGGTVMVTVMCGFGLVMAVRVHRYLELPKGRGFI
jgi:rod shape determining protein RodA